MSVKGRLDIYADQINTFWSIASGAAVEPDSDQQCRAEIFDTLAFANQHLPQALLAQSSCPETRENMVLDSALQGHAAGAKELLAAVTKDPSLLEDPASPFSRSSARTTRPAAPEARDGRRRWWRIHEAREDAVPRGAEERGRGAGRC